ncbi:YitT family protein [Lagierella sp.]|uniref:YitT family protein n=1 Tax=Lagierella sp. TaxID=2849657 RepID=UPI0026211118|nr:YitT family protein [Lagierella sp.]
MKEDLVKDKVSQYLGTKREFVRRILATIIGDFICAFGMTFFFQQKGFLSGGVGGIGLLLKFMYDIPAGLTVFVLNIPLVILGYFLINKKFTTYAMISAFVLSGALLFFDQFQNPFILEDSFLVAVIGGAINGLGMGILFRNGSSQGGLDILAGIFKQRFNVNIGNALFGMNIIIILMGSYIFTLDKGLYTVIAMAVGYNLLDKIQMGLGERKQIMIISSQYDEIKRQIIQKVNRGVTFLEGCGGYKNTNYKVIYTVIGTRQLAQVKQIVSDADGNAFMAVTDAYEVKGKGFTSSEL